VSQESQILPAFLICLNEELCAKEFENWTREKVNPSDKQDYKNDITREDYNNDITIEDSEQSSLISLSSFQENNNYIIVNNDDYVLMES
jgi:hypothetical protein